MTSLLSGITVGLCAAALLAVALTATSSKTAESCYDVEEKECFHNWDTQCHKTNVYRGSKATTWNGLACDQWSKRRRNKKFRSLPSNYCRNPTKRKGGAWCFTKHRGVRWDYCFKSCADNCYNDETACLKKSDPKCKFTSFYQGTKNTTKSGRKCQEWAMNEPHKHKRNRVKFPSNYCRNPDLESNGAWCYTMDPDVRWEYCFKSTNQCRTTTTRENLTRTREDKDGQAQLSTFERIRKSLRRRKSQQTIIREGSNEKCRVPKLTYGEVIINGKKSEQSTISVGESMEFHCNPGHKLHGNAILKCFSAQKLDYPVPICIISEPGLVYG